MNIVYKHSRLGSHIRKLSLYMKLKEDAHKVKIMETYWDDCKVNKEYFDYTLTNLPQKKKSSYDFIVKSSKDFKVTVFKLTKMMIEEETCPSRFFENPLCQLWKKKGGLNDLNNHR